MQQSLSSRVDSFRQNNVKFVYKPDEVIKILERAIRNKPKYIVYDVESTGLNSFAGKHWMYFYEDKIKEGWGARVFCFGLGIYNEKKDILYCLYIDSRYKYKKEYQHAARLLACEFFQRS